VQLKEVDMPVLTYRLALGASLVPICGYALAANIGFLHNAPISRMNGEDLELFHATVTEVLEKGANGAEVRWQNAKTGAGGTVTPLNSYQGQAGPCRDVEIENAAGGLRSRNKFSLCKTAAGEWRVRQD
jgi:surface antigen